MCGIVGYIGEKNAKDVVIKGLERLEYRGYDSAGLAIDSHNALINISKSVGKLDELKNHIASLGLNGTRAIGHTRWATHGEPSDLNAHPHSYGRVTVVHNGIIENHAELRAQLQALGHKFISQTDTEIVAHIFDNLLTKNLDPISALKHVGFLLKGSFSLAIIINGYSDQIYYIKNGAPLIVALGDNESFLASDQIALVDFRPDFYAVDNGEYGSVSTKKIAVFGPDGQEKSFELKPLLAKREELEKMGHQHFMHKEIFEQPQTITRVLAGRVDNGLINFTGFEIDFSRLSHVDRIHIIACGSSYFAGLIAKFSMEEIFGLPVEVEIASEYRYRRTLTQARTLVIAISQSGETADTLAGLEKALAEGALCLSVCNVIGSAITRLCHQSLGNLYLHAGPEISVASTKAFVANLVALKLLSLAMAKSQSKISDSQERELLAVIKSLSVNIGLVLEQDQEIRIIAQSLVNEAHMMFLGRGELYPIALEGALKMKELSYIFADGYPAGELKHGPIATINPGMPAVVLFANDHLKAKTASNLEQVKTRGAKIIIIGPSSPDLTALSPLYIKLPDCDARAVPILATVALQLLAYHVSDLKGLDVDKPRNLAKSVTVE